MHDASREAAERELVNRFTFHPGTAVTGPMHDRVRTELREVALRLDVLLPAGREKALTITKLEEAMFWANAAVARSS